MHSFIISLLTAAVLLSGSVTAHSWNEQFSLIGSNGSYTGAYGYPRGYVARTDPGFNGDSVDYLLPPLSSGRTRVNGSDLLCHPAQRSPKQSANWPRLTVAPGSAVAMKYLENGHVSLPLNQKGKPPKGGTVFVFGTTQPMQDEKLTEIMEWTKDGSGGDKRGVLLTANNFDDDRCYQINSGTISTERQKQFPNPVAGQPGSQHEQWCETDLVLPKDAAVMPVGKLFTIYWVWQWPTAAGQDPGLPTGKDEYYTTCSDFEVVASVPDGPVIHELGQQDPQMNAVSNYASRTAITPLPSAAPQTSTPATSAAAVTPPPSSAALSAPPAAQFNGAPAAGTPTTTPVFASSILLPSINLPGSAATSSTTNTPAPDTTPAASTSTTVPITTDTLSHPNILTAFITVTATMPPGQSTLLVSGSHVVTFTLPSATLLPRQA